MDTAVESNELVRSWSFPSILTPRRFVNVFSLSRIVLAFLFVTCFQKSASLLYVSIAICVVALVTDLLDGFFARRLKVDSVHGRLWDSLGDKSFYCAVIISFNAQGFLGPTITWALIVREVALYITRILYIQNLPQVERIRPSTNWHGYFMYATIVLGMAQMYAEIHHLSFALTQFVQWSAFAALLFGLFSIFHFIRLDEPKRCSSRGK
jgi:phosphatidylglycerophosphate synthase